MPDLCTYTMTPSGKTFPVWSCRLPANHKDHHEPRESYTEIRQSYFMAGAGAKPKKGPTILVPGHEVPVTDVVKMTKTGKINTQSTLGKLVVALRDSGWELHAGESIYLSTTGKEKTWRWIEARTHGKHLLANEDGITVNGGDVTVQEALEVIAGG